LKRKLEGMVRKLEVLRRKLKGMVRKLEGNVRKPTAYDSSALNNLHTCLMLKKLSEEKVINVPWNIWRYDAGWVRL
jgi:hypothetical protein